MTHYVSPNAPTLFGKTDSETIMNAVKAAVENGTACLLSIIEYKNTRLFGMLKLRRSC